MNKFLVFPCIKQEAIEGREGYSGPVVSLGNASNISFVLFFPVSEENASLINYVLEKPPSKQKINAGSVLGIYKTMIDSWSAGERFLSGILMDMEYDEEIEQEVINVRLVISDDHGSIDSVVKTNFIHAILLAAMERKEVLVSNELLSKLLPKTQDDEMDEEDMDDIENEENEENIKDVKEVKDVKKLPVDKEILEIAKQIMSGKIK